jgi:hypothetical protein
MCRIVQVIGVNLTLVSQFGHTIRSRIVAVVPASSGLPAASEVRRDSGNGSASGPDQRSFLGIVEFWHREHQGIPPELNLA